MDNAPEVGCGGCSSSQVQALFCELVDVTTTAARVAEIRAHLARCEACNERLQREETIREMLSTCCGSHVAPATLRTRISVSITEIRFG